MSGPNSMHPSIGSVPVIDARGAELDDLRSCDAAVATALSSVGGFGAVQNAQSRGVGERAVGRRDERGVRDGRAGLASAGSAITASTRGSSTIASR